MANKKDIVKACPLNIDQMFQLFEAYNTLTYRNQQHIIQTTLRYRDAKSGKHVFVLIHALVEEGQIESFDVSPVEAALDVFPTQIEDYDEQKMTEYLSSIRVWMEDSDVDGECFTLFLDWVGQVYSNHLTAIANAIDEYNEYWESPG